MTLYRRHLLLVAAAAPWSARAHHGWSSFDLARPVYLEGRVRRVRWQNPHAELDLEVPQNLRVPADLAQRAVPAQQAPVDGKALLAQAVVPTRQDRIWTVELAPVPRMQAWEVPNLTPGTALSVVGFTLQGEKGDAVVRAEYLFLAGRAYGLRSSPV